MISWRNNKIIHVDYANIGHKTFDYLHSAQQRL